ncbi:MAG: hypothetical protein RIR50_257, partial [Pseudomonadota bacterium]
MNNKKWRKALQPKAIALAAVLVVSSASTVAQNLPDLGVTSGDPWSVENYYENHTAKRESVGLSKFRNTFQSEMSKNLNDGWRFRGILRGTYDGVYDLNDSEYGKNAGGPVQMGNASGPGADYVLTNILNTNGLGPYATAMVPYGGGIGSTLAEALAGAQPSNTFVNNGVIPVGT